MTNKTKILSIILITLLAVVATLPDSDNYYQTAIDLIAAEQGLQSNELQLKSGSYQNLMLFKTIHMDLITAQSVHIQAELKQVPFFDWQLSHYQITD